MHWFGVIAMGIIQGLSEFLPVSSSGHLVVGSKLLKLTETSLAFDVMLHVGTLLPVLWLYRQDLLTIFRAIPRIPQAKSQWDELGMRFGICTIISAIPTGLTGILLKDMFESLFNNLLAVAVAFAVTGTMLFLSSRYVRKVVAAEGFKSLTAGKAFLMGLAQSVAITPGISRSGSTIATGLLLGVERETAAKFSFVMSIPAILGATVLQLRKASLDGPQMTMYAVGAVAAAISGYLALLWVVRLVKHGEFHRFAYYLWPLSVFVLVASFLQ